jgi:hypothetical protein
MQSFEDEHDDEDDCGCGYAALLPYLLLYRENQRCAVP